MSGPITRLVQRTVDVRGGEIAALIWSAAYFFCVLSAYYVLRPIRDEAGVAGGVENLAWLFTGTLAGMLLVHPVYAALVARLPRRRFVPLTYRFFVLHLVIFFLLYKFIDPSKSVWIGRIFFIWGSIFNLFVVSVFWSFMTDLYRPGQGRRLFGMVAVGGSIGAIAGSSITSALAGPLGPVNLLLVSALLIELACQASRALERHEPALAAAADDDEKPEAPGAVTGSESLIGGGVLDGIRRVAMSPYLLGIAGLMLFFTIASTFLYFQQADIVSRVFENDRAGRTRLFANRDLAVNVLTLLTQIFLTGRIMRWFGLGVALAFLPVLSLIGFGILGVAPTLAVVIGFEILRRAGNFAIQRPAREVLYTVLPRLDKYKAKNFNDTFVYRAGDQLGAWSYTLMGKLGLGFSALAFSMVPLSMLWLVLALWLGWKYARLAPVAGKSGGS